MDIEIKYRPSNTAARFTLSSGESLTSESGAMIAMSQGLAVETTTYKKGAGSILKSLKRMFAGESFFLNHYSATSQSELWLSSSLPGDMQVIDVGASEMVVQSGSFLACTSGVEIDVGWQGFKNLFSSESLFWLKIKNSTGAKDQKCVLTSFGSMYWVDVQGEYVVDTGHIVAFESTLNFKLSKAGSSWMHSIMGGEGIVCRFTGHGRLLCQSHNLSSFGHRLTPHLKPKKG